VQRGTILVATGATSNTATIASVDTANSRLRSLGYSLSGGGVLESAMMTRVSFTNATTVTATLSGAAGVDSTSSYEVTAYYPGVLRSVQRGTVTGAGTATITSVNLTFTELDFLGNTTVGANTNITDVARIVQTNATTITGTSNGGANSTSGYQAMELT
jgi:hypothetical protein